MARAARAGGGGIALTDPARDVSAGPTTIIHDHQLAQGSRKGVSDKTDGGIATAACGVCDDDPDRFGRVIVTTPHAVDSDRMAAWQGLEISVYGYIAHPTRFVSALKKCPCVVVTKSVVMSGPPKQQLVGRIAGTGCVSSTRPVGENT